MNEYPISDDLTQALNHTLASLEGFNSLEISERYRSIFYRMLYLAYLEGKADGLIQVTDIFASASKEAVKNGEEEKE